MKKFDYPKYVWSPSGGWWCNPRHWKRNTMYAFLVCCHIKWTEFPTLPVVSGVPQGSVLVLFFSLFVLLMSLVLSPTSYSSINFILVQQNINSICAWVNQNSLLLNTLKCYTLFSRKPTPALPHLSCLSTTMFCTWLKNLISIMESLSPPMHPRHLISILFTKSCWHSLPEILPLHSPLKLYLSKVHPHLEYALHGTL